jgi:GNAT superfamily N-acetyltransferase
MSYEIDEKADADTLSAAVRQGIREADPRGAGCRDWQPLALALRAPDGTVVGGLYGATMWTWLMIDGLWVDAGLRRQGLGRRLLLAAEGIAIERGCRGSWLGTFDFQAREFYEKQGYVVFATLPGFPPGHTHFHLSRQLTAANGPPSVPDCESK